MAKWNANFFPGSKLSVFMTFIDFWTLFLVIFRTFDSQIISAVSIQLLQVLRLLWRKQDLNQQEIANAVVRLEDPSAKRSRIISLTPAGREYKEQFMPVINEFYKLMETDLTSTEIE